MNTYKFTVTIPIPPKAEEAMNTRKLKTPKELGITAAQRRNLARLCLFVKDKVPPPKFDIKVWYRSSMGVQMELPIDAQYECGSSACFLGYAPLCKIKPLRDEDWGTFSGRVFGASEYGGLDQQALYNLLFGPNHENFKSAAVRRGAYFLMHGFPETSSPFSTWEAPKSFRPNWKLIKEASE